MGFGAIYTFKEERQKQQFTSWHAWAGVAAMLWMGMGALGGLFNTINITKFKLNWVWSDKLHGLSGRLAAILGMVCVGLGFVSHWAQKVLGPQWQIGLGLLSAAIDRKSTRLNSSH